jgi:hypothetical protein
MEVPPQNNNAWDSGLCGCCASEESCWWGTWCCWLLHARTLDSINIASTADTIKLYWLSVLATVLFLLFFPGFGGLLLIFCT